MKYYLRIILKYLLLALTVIVLIFLIFIGFKACRNIFGFYITAQFEDLAPSRKAMPVYFKGYKIGITGKIKPSDDYKHSSVKIIFPKRLNKFPKNITAKIKKFDSGEKYLELIYPKSPSGYKLKKGWIINGKTAVDMASFMAEQADSGALANLSGNMSSALTSAQKTSDEIGKLFLDAREALNENRKNISDATRNVAILTQNAAKLTEDLQKTTTKLNNGIETKQIGNVITNIEHTTENIKNVTENMDKATKNLDKTFEKIDSTITEANASVTNVTAITEGFLDTFGKRFGTMKVMFGTPVDKKGVKKPTNAASSLPYRDDVCPLRPEK